MSPAPAEAELTATLGETKGLWDAIIAEFSTTQEWKRYSQKAPWSLRLFRGKRTIIWLSPREGWFQAAIILGDRAIDTAKESKPSQRLRKLIDEAPRYPEGTGLRIEVKNTRDLALVRKLAAIKIAH
ncbi:MAG: DUF3788 family protein [Bryobacteraceae bacterium]